jgi:hypothetical protein
MKNKTKSDEKELTDNVNITYDDSACPIIGDIIASVKGSQLDDFDILCDNGATVSIVKNKGLLNNIRIS